MPTIPSSQFETYRPDLAGALMEFDLQADQAGFVGPRIAPVIEVQMVGGVYPRIELKELLKARDTRRSDRGGYNRGFGRGTKGNYLCEEHGFEEPVDEREAAIYAEYWDAELLAAERSRDAVLRNYEQRVIDAATAISHTTAADAVWSNLSSASPIADVEEAKQAIRDRTGMIANCLVIGWEHLQFLKDNEEILDRVKYSGHTDPKKGSITAPVLADALDLEEVIVAGSVKNTANEAVAADLASMWPVTQALLFYRYGGMDLRRAQFMRTFHWGADGSRFGGTFESYHSAEVRGDVIRNRMDTDEKVIYEDCAERITGVTA